MKKKLWYAPQLIQLQVNETAAPHKDKNAKETSRVCKGHVKGRLGPCS